MDQVLSKMKVKTTKEYHDGKNDLDQIIGLELQIQEILLKRRVSGSGPLDLVQEEDTKVFVI